MNSKEALEFVESIEAHREEEAKLWDELRNRDGYQMHEDKVLESIIQQRKSARDHNDRAMADISGFDLVFDENGEVVPA